ncbi:MAG: MBL fold metallo-hydrolase [Candidatus Aegiribacteria sp.]|nr:MBL fold metallo-hydrolase [Candidatus Aegiribacteria sp.]
MSFRIRILFNDTARRTDLATGIGFSALIGDDLLFDTGNDGGSLLANMTVLGIDPIEINTVVISHDHWDHTGGLTGLLSIKPGITVYGCHGFSEELKQTIKLKNGVFESCAGYRQIGPGIFLTGEIPADYKGSYLAEQAMVLQSEKGISIITGCAHPGIVRIVDNVKEHFSADSIHIVGGGFHLHHHDKRGLREVLQQLATRNISFFAPMHCTGNRAIEAFAAMFGSRAKILASGDSIEI